MFARFFPPPPDAKLTNEPATLVAALGGDLGDIAHDEAALERATALAQRRLASGAVLASVLQDASWCFGVLSLFARSTLNLSIRGLVRDS